MLIDIKCKLCKFGRGVTVPGEGSTTPKLIVVSDYPGENELKLRRPFMGRSGQLLRKALTNVVGLDVDNEVFLTNVLKCPPRDDKITDNELNACKKWLDAELSQVKCRFVLVCGDKAKQVLLPHLEGKDNALSKIHGQVFQDPLKTRQFLVTWNPAMVDQYSPLHEQTEDRIILEGSLPWMFLNDMRKLKKLLEGA